MMNAYDPATLPPDMSASLVEAGYEDEPPYVEFEPSETHPLLQGIKAGLRTVFDPEIPVNIYELGLIYKISILENNDVAIEMTLTSPGCPVAGELPGWVKDAVEKADGVGSASVELVWHPPWTPDVMAETAKLMTNMY